MYLNPFHQPHVLSISLTSFLSASQPFYQSQRSIAWSFSFPCGRILSLFIWLTVLCNLLFFLIIFTGACPSDGILGQYPGIPLLIVFFTFFLLGLLGCVDTGAFPWLPSVVIASCFSGFGGLLLPAALPGGGDSLPGILRVWGLALRCPLHPPRSARQRGTLLWVGAWAPSPGGKKIRYV